MAYENSGAPAEKPVVKKRKRKPAARRLMSGGEHISPNIVLCADGKYRWTYKLSLFKNPTIFLLVWKILFFILLGIWIFETLLSLGSPGFFWDGFLEQAKIWALVILVMTGVSFLGYSLYAAYMGGKYCVLFEMDEKGINHKQFPSQAKKAGKIAGLATAAGAASGNLAAAGAGMNVRTEMYSEFSRTRRVKAYRRRKLIKVNGILSRNQVYTEPEDFDFVLDYINARVPDKAKSK